MIVLSSNQNTHKYYHLLKKKKKNTHQFLVQIGLNLDLALNYHVRSSNQDTKIIALSSNKYTNQFLEKTGLNQSSNSTINEIKERNRPVQCGTCQVLPQKDQQLVACLSHQKDLRAQFCHHRQETQCGKSLPHQNPTMQSHHTIINHSI